MGMGLFNLEKGFTWNRLKVKSTPTCKSVMIQLSISYTIGIFNELIRIMILRGNAQMNPVVRRARDGGLRFGEIWISYLNGNKTWSQGYCKTTLVQYNKMTNILCKIFKLSGTS